MWNSYLLPGNLGGWADKCKEGPNLQCKGEWVTWCCCCLNKSSLYWVRTPTPLTPFLMKPEVVSLHLLWFYFNLHQTFLYISFTRMIQVVTAISHSKPTHSFNVIFPTLCLGSFFFPLKMDCFVPIPLLHSLNFKQTKQIMSKVIGQRHL